MKRFSEVSKYNRTAARVLGGISLFLLVGGLITVWAAYRDAKLPRVTGHIERTWIAYGYRSYVRFADLRFTIPNDGKPINCLAQNVYIGPPNLVVTVGDNVELMTRPGSCEKPRVPIGASGWVVMIIFWIGGLTSGLLMLLARIDDRSRLSRLTAEFGWFIWNSRNSGRLRSIRLWPSSKVR
jgi:hypothetical protein